MFRNRLQFFLPVLTIIYSVHLTSQQTTGLCPDGVQSLPIDCDPKHPWPRCPPQTYCYATNSVDVGPYFCCPTGVVNDDLNYFHSEKSGIVLPQSFFVFSQCENASSFSSYSVSPNNLPSSIFATTTQWPIPNPLPSIQTGTWPSSQGIAPIKARKPPVNEDTKRIRNSINQWLEKRQQGVRSSTTSQK
ncbi:hypothetical protein Y032_0451g1687 [Ancylostoma ceylanicum]|uniref:Uncharacterized protein n=1 Tax=Ancylostoma ceylanicum TaxID=53326 RepID=A0A016WYL0_9BILA|nr:hypothetical protein Y032_0451g1687 [Ancylostoma ceylanicum]